MRKALNISQYTVIGYSMVAGGIICILASHPFILNLIEKAIETRMNPLNIVDWIWILIGS